MSAVHRERQGRWAGPARDYFFIPGADAGLYAIDRPDWLIRPVKGARVRQYARSEHPAIQRRLERNLEDRWHRTPVIFETNTFLALAEAALFSAGSLRIRGKWLTNGAAGDRVFARFLKHNRTRAALDDMIAFFRAARTARESELPPWRGDTSALPVGIECRNRTNYYHFMTETLPQLTHLCDRGEGPITVYCRNAQASGFSEAFVQALFPELAGRIVFTDRATRHDRVVIPLNVRHLILASGDDRISGPLLRCCGDPAWQDLTAHTQGRKFVLKNSFDHSLRRMRDRALDMAADLPDRARPERILVLRDPQNKAANQRDFLGQDLLWDRLRALGFQKVYFERLAPLEQVATMNAARVIVSAHGAFFANMMFAHPDAHVIEIGSVQTQFHRWGDFLGNAHVAGCRYSMVFADLAQQDPSVIPPITEGLIGVQVGRSAIDLICDLAEAGQPD